MSIKNLDAEMDNATADALAMLGDAVKDDQSLAEMREFVPYPVIYVDPEEYWHSLGFE